MYDGVKSEKLSTTKFDKNSDLSTTYLCRINIIRLDKIKVEERFPISEQGYIVHKLLDGMEGQILLAKEECKSCMSKSHYLRHILNHYIHYQSLHLKLREFK